MAIDYDTMQQKLFTALAGGKAPDIGMIDFSWMGGFIKDGALVPIPAADAKAWMSSVSPETVAISDWGGGKMYGYSTWGVDAYALTWNKTMFKDAGLDPNAAPKYWADFRAASKKTAVADSSGKITRVGYAMRHTGQPHGIVDKWHWLLVGAGHAAELRPVRPQGRHGEDQPARHARRPADGPRHGLGGQVQQPRLPRSAAGAVSPRSPPCRSASW